MQGAAEFHHEIADTVLPQPDPVFHDTAAFHAAIDMLDPQPTVVQGLVVCPLVFDRFQNRVQSFEFHTGVSGGELPVDLHLYRIPGALLGSDFAYQRGKVRDAAVNHGGTPMAAPRKQRVDTSPAPDVSTQGVPPVYDDQLISMISDLTEIVTWWQERKATLHQTSDANRETGRTTFHVERRWIEAIRRQADLDHLTITQVVNEAFRQHFKGK
jgi:hypothetical protein